MPRYDFQCKDCKELFEVQRSMSDTSKVTCPMCDSTNTQKLILQGPGIFVNWKNTQGLGSKGTVIMTQVDNGPLQRRIDRENSVLRSKTRLGNHRKAHRG